MKLERVLRKAVPFLLIAILIACLFSMPRCEGFKGFTKVHSEKSFDRDSKDWFKDNAKPLGISAGATAGAAVIYKGGNKLRGMLDDYNANVAKTEHAERIFYMNKEQNAALNAWRYGKDVEDVDDLDHA